MTQTTVKTHISAKVIVMTLTLMLGIGIVAVFAEASKEMGSRPTNSVSRQFIELEKPTPATTTEAVLGST